MNIKFVDFIGKDKVAKIGDIRKFEKLLPNPLPKEYVDYILQYPTGEKPEDDLFFDIKEYGVFDSDIVAETGMLDSLSSVKDLFMHFKCLSSNDWDEQSVPDDMVMIGDGGGSNGILIGISGENRGKVFYWKESLFVCDESYSNYYGNIGLIANGFNDFIACLRE